MILLLYEIVGLLNKRISLITKVRILHDCIVQKNDMIIEVISEILYNKYIRRGVSMLKYIVLFKFRDPEECLPTVIEKLHSMEGIIPEILSMETGVDLWHNGERSYDLALICTFRDMEAVAIYDKHPYHEKIREYIYAHRVDGKTVIYEI